MLIKISNLFHIERGNKFNFNVMKVSAGSNINFVSRTSQNNGVVSMVEPVGDISPFPEGLITVSLGGTYLLSSFIQNKPFYTAQNIDVLIPKKNMTFEEKMFYCIAIGENRFRYRAFGREANKTLKDIEVPSTVPDWVYSMKMNDLMKLDTDKGIFRLNEDIIDNSRLNNEEYNLETSTWKEFVVGDTFTCELGTPTHLSNLSEDSICDHYYEGLVPYVTRSGENNGISRYLSIPASEKGNCITVGAEGVKSFYQLDDFITGNKINKIYHLKLNKYNALFICTVLDLVMEERFNYGRGVVLSKLKELKINLPCNKDNEPDWDYMEDYIKSLHYSNSI